MFDGVEKGEIVAIEEEVKVPLTQAENALKVGDTIPSVGLWQGFPNDEKITARAWRASSVSSRMRMAPSPTLARWRWSVPVGIMEWCKRWAFYAVKGEVKVVNVSEYEGDPTGDGYPEITLSATMIKAIAQA